MRALLALVLLLTACNILKQEPAWHAPMPAPPAEQVAGPAKIKARGPVTLIYQVASPGAVASPATSDNRKAGSRQGAAATAQDASATNSSQRAASAAWWVWGLVAVAGAVGWEWLSHQLPRGWLRWRARVA